MAVRYGENYQLIEGHYLIMKGDTKMAKGEIIINENSCRGCGYCEYFCSRKCIVISADKLNLSGYPVAVFVDPDKCNACGVCSWMCPAFAIEVYKYVESQPSS